jgi:hypothetical protein
MKIEIEIPEWAEDEYKDWFIISGSEQRAYFKHNEKKWHIKTKGCVMCGNCCVNLPKGQYELDAKGDCIHLGQDGDKRPCNLGIMSPWTCIEGDPTKGQWGKLAGCSIRYDGDK